MADVRRAAGVAGRGDDDDAVGEGILQGGPDHRTGLAVAQRHADHVGPVPDRERDGLGQRVLDPAVGLVLVGGVPRVVPVGHHPDREDPGRRGHAHDAAAPARVPVPGDQRGHPGPVHPPVRVGPRSVHPGQVGTGGDRAGQVGYGRVDPAVDHGDGRSLPPGHRPGSWRADRVEHPHLGVSHGVGPGGAGTAAPAAASTPSTSRMAAARRGVRGDISMPVRPGSWRGVGRRRSAWRSSPLSRPRRSASRPCHRDRLTRGPGACRPRSRRWT